MTGDFTQTLRGEARSVIAAVGGANALIRSPGWQDQLLEPGLLEPWLLESYPNEALCLFGVESSWKVGHLQAL